jgi:hypothetical protein
MVRYFLVLMLLEGIDWQTPLRTVEPIMSVRVNCSVSMRLFNNFWTDSVTSFVDASAPHPARSGHPRSGSEEGDDPSSARSRHGSEGAVEFTGERDRTPGPAGEKLQRLPDTILDRLHPMSKRPNDGEFAATAPRERREIKCDIHDGPCQSGETRPR